MAVERIEPAFDGLDTDTAPDYLKKTKAPVLDNFLVDRPGMLPIRGPIFDSIDLYAGTVAEKPVGVWAHNNNVLIGLKANSSTAVRDPWVAPYRRTSTTGDLSDHHTSLYHVDLETKAVTEVTSATETTTPGPRSARLGAYTYGISFSGTSDETVNGGLQRRTALCRWDGTAVLPTAIATGFAPSCMQDVKSYINRLFVLGGNVPGTTGAVKPTSLFWSDQGGPTAGTLAEWQDDVSGLANQLVVGSDDPSDFGVALAVLSFGLVIFKRRSIHVLRGDSPASFSLKTFTTEQGCIDPRSVVEYEDGVFFMSDQGFMFFDGAQLMNASPDLRSTLLADALAAVGNSGVDGGAVTASRLPNDYIGVTISTLTNTAGVASTTHFAGIYHPPNKAWAGLSSDALSVGAPISVGRALSKTYLVDDQRLFSADALTAPEQATEAQRGLDNVGAVFTFDADGNGPTFNGTDDALTNQTTGVEAWTSSTDTPIPARWHSRLAVLAQPTSLSRIERLLMDYTFQVDGSTDDAEVGWYVELIDGRGNVLLSSRQVPAQGDPSTHAYRRQFSADVKGEANDAQLRVEWRGTNALSLVKAAILSAYLTNQPAQERGSF